MYGMFCLFPSVSLISQKYVLTWLPLSVTQPEAQKAGEKPWDRLMPISQTQDIPYSLGTLWTTLPCPCLPHTPLQVLSRTSFLG